MYSCYFPELLLGVDDECVAGDNAVRVRVHHSNEPRYKHK